MEPMDHVQEVIQPQPSVENVETRSVVKDVSNYLQEATEENKGDKNEQVSKQDGEKTGEPVTHDQTKPSKYDREIARMTRQKHELRSEMDKLRQELDGLKKPKEQAKELKATDFATIDDYIAYREKLLIDRITNEQNSALETRKNASQQMQSWEQKILSHFDTEEKLQEYGESISEIQPMLEHLPKEAQTFIYNSDVGAPILKWFGDNPHQLERFLNEHPWKQPQVLLSIENYLTKQYSRSIGGSAPSGQATETSQAKPQPRAIGTVQAGQSNNASKDSESIEEILAQIRSRR